MPDKYEIPHGSYVTGTAADKRKERAKYIYDKNEYNAIMEKEKNKRNSRSGGKKKTKRVHKKKTKLRKTRKSKTRRHKKKHH